MRPLVTGTTNVSEYEGTLFSLAGVCAVSPSDPDAIAKLVARMTTVDCDHTLVANTFTAVMAFENAAFPVTYKPSIVKRFENTLLPTHVFETVTFPVTVIFPDA
jgi:hypothetical protein